MRRWMFEYAAFWLIRLAWFVGVPGLIAALVLLGMGCASAPERPAREEIAAPHIRPLPLLPEPERFECLAPSTAGRLAAYVASADGLYEVTEALAQTVISLNQEAAALDREAHSYSVALSAAEREQQVQLWSWRILSAGALVGLMARGAAE